MQVEDLIQTGHKNAITRSELRRLTGLRDRKVRKEIQRMRLDYPIINTGKGYYIPDMADPIDRIEARAYIDSEKAKAREITVGLHEVIRAIYGL